MESEKFTPEFSRCEMEKANRTINRSVFFAVNMRLATGRHAMGGISVVMPQQVVQVLQQNDLKNE